MALKTMTKEVRVAHGFVDSNGTVIRPTTNAAESAHKMFKQDLEENKGQQWNEIHVLVPQLDAKLDQLQTKMVMAIQGLSPDFRLTAWAIKILPLLAKKMKVIPPSDLDELDFNVWMDVKRCRTVDEPTDLKSIYGYIHKPLCVQPAFPATKVYPRFYTVCVDFDWTVEMIVQRLVLFKWDRLHAIEFAVEVLARSKDANAVTLAKGGFWVKSYRGGAYMVTFSNGNEPVCANPACRNKRKLCYHIMLVFICNRYDLTLLLETLGAPKGFTKAKLTTLIRRLTSGDKSIQSMGRKKNQNTGGRSKKSPSKADKKVIASLASIPSGLQDERPEEATETLPQQEEQDEDSQDEEGSEDESLAENDSLVEEEQDAVAPSSPRAFSHSNDSEGRIILWSWIVYEHSCPLCSLQEHDFKTRLQSSNIC
jgi:hypothetical protein